MDIYLRVHHILAIGCSKRFMAVYIDDDHYQYIRISDKFYCWLRSQGVLSAQKLRYLKYSKLI